MTPSANIVKISARKTHIFFFPFFFITQGAKIELQSFCFLFQSYPKCQSTFFFSNLNKKGRRKCHSVLTCDETLSVLVVPFPFSWYMFINNLSRLLFKLFLVDPFFFAFLWSCISCFHVCSPSCVTCDSSPMECCPAISERERHVSGRNVPQCPSRRTQENWRGGNDDIEKMYEELVNLRKKTTEKRMGKMRRNMFARSTVPWIE